MTLVELCAASAAVSLRWLRSDARPPLAWQGGKRGYADAILHAMGLAPGAGRGHDVVLVEPGPWGEAWALWRTAAGRADTIERLRAWHQEDPRTLWGRLRSEPVPVDHAERVAVWAVLQWWNFARKPVLAVSGRWREHGFNAVDAYRAEYQRRMRAERGTWANGIRIADARDMSVAVLLEEMAALPDLSHVTVLPCRAEEVAPIPGALVYIDPDYQGTTSAYGHTFPRPAVLETAERWRRAGCVVAISEAEPLPLPGWHPHPLPRSSGFGRTWSRQQSEWLTLSQPARGQLSLIEGVSP